MSKKWCDEYRNETYERITQLTYHQLYIGASNMYFDNSTKWGALYAPIRLTI